MEKNCIICGESLDGRIKFNNTDREDAVKIGPDILTFPNIPPKKSAHLECYINICIEKYLNKTVDKND